MSGELHNDCRPRAVEPQSVGPFGRLDGRETSRRAERGTWLAFLGNVWVRWILTALALVELVIDQLPSTPGRTVPVQFGHEY